MEPAAADAGTRRRPPVSGRAVGWSGHPAHVRRAVTNRRMEAAPTTVCDRSTRCRRGVLTARPRPGRDPRRPGGAVRVRHGPPGRRPAGHNTPLRFAERSREPSDGGRADDEFVTTRRAAGGVSGRTRRPRASACRQVPRRRSMTTRRYGDGVFGRRRSPSPRPDDAPGLGIGALVQVVDTDRGGEQLGRPIGARALGVIVAPGGNQIGGYPGSASRFVDRRVRRARVHEGRPRPLRARDRPESSTGPGGTGAAVAGLVLVPRSRS